MASMSFMVPAFVLLDLVTGLDKTGVDATIFPRGTAGIGWNTLGFFIRAFWILPCRLAVFGHSQC